MNIIIIQNEATINNTIRQRVYKIISNSGKTKRGIMEPLYQSIPAEIRWNIQDHEATKV